MSQKTKKGPKTHVEATIEVLEPTMRRKAQAVIDFTVKILVAEIVIAVAAVTFTGVSGIAAPDKLFKIYLPWIGLIFLFFYAQFSATKFPLSTMYAKEEPIFRMGIAMLTGCALALELDLILQVGPLLFATNHQDFDLFEPILSSGLHWAFLIMVGTAWSLLIYWIHGRSGRYLATLIYSLALGATSLYLAALSIIVAVLAPDSNSFHIWPSLVIAVLCFLWLVPSIYYLVEFKNCLALYQSLLLKQRHAEMIRKGES